MCITQNTEVKYQNITSNTTDSHIIWYGFWLVNVRASCRQFSSDNKNVLQLIQINVKFKNIYSDL